MNGALKAMNGALEAMNGALKAMNGAMEAMNGAMEAMLRDFVFLHFSSVYIKKEASQIQ